MKKSSILLFVLFILSCEKDNSFTPLPSPDMLLTTIEYITEGKTWTEDFTYTEEKQLIQVENLGFSAKRYELMYQQEQLKEVKTYRLSDNQLESRNELIYNEQGQMTKTLEYYFQEGKESSRVYTSEYKYDKNSLLIQQSTYWSDDDAYLHTEKYTWKNGNIVKTATHENENLSYEFFYKYDDAYNYMRFQTHLVNEFSIWNQNNIIHSSYKDYTGLLDTYCNPCLYDFTYNEAGLPVTIDFTDLITYQLTYQ